MDWKIRTGRELLVIAVVCFAAGCTKQIYVPIESLVRDTLVQTRQKIDSIIVKDSVMVAERGDTIVKEVWRWRIKTRQRVDTVYKSRVDTMKVVVPVMNNANKETVRSRESVVAAWIRWGTRGVMVIILIIFLWQNTPMKSILKRLLKR